MRVNDVELTSAPKAGTEGKDESNLAIGHVPAPQGGRHHGNQLGGGLRVAAREQGDRMAAPHQLFGYERHNPLGPAIFCWGHGHKGRGQLGNT